MYYTLPCNVHQPVTVLAQRLPRPIAVTIQLVLAYRTSRELGLKPRLIRKVQEGQLCQTVRASALVVDSVKFASHLIRSPCVFCSLLCAGMYEVPNFLGCAGAPPFWMGAWPSPRNMLLPEMFYRTKICNRYYPRDIVSTVYATATWLGGWVSVTRRYCIKMTKPIKSFPTIW